MTPAYVGHFGLAWAPSSKKVVDADLWLPTSKAALVEELGEALRNRASVVLTGELGVGKTTYCARCAAVFPPRASGSPTATTPPWAAATSTASCAWRSA
ncbi:hypothetical protein [Myxococcus xanthus]|uniref:hypothetical protein n=1 Tax=Myxococcus xanthus TaxID=34 RepID=UPI001CEC8747|nr:hypothetical protein [Myxococcus xanthus]